MFSAVVAVVAVAVAVAVAAQGSAIHQKQFNDIRMAAVPDTLTIRTILRRTRQE